MCHRYFLTIVGFFIANLSTTFAQRDTLTGFWKGVLTVEKDEQILAEYDVFFSFTEENDSIVGFSTIVYKNLAAKLSFKATRKNDDILEIKEINIIKADALSAGEWCVKNITLKRFFEKDKVVWRGEWTGKTSFSDCVPGKIYLKKAVQRA
jgi:hypothetical protein